MRRTTLLVVVTTLFLLYITCLAVILSNRSEANAYLARALGEKDIFTGYDQ